jgi:type IV pilus assembly protein PilB
MYLRRDIVSKKQLLGQILLKRGMITKEQLQYALDCQKKEGGVLGETLIKLGYVTEQDIVVALIVQCGLPYIAVNKYEIDRKVIDIIPANIARRFHIVPLDRVGDVLSVVMAKVEQITGCKVATFIATKTEIDEAIERWYSTKE